MTIESKMFGVSLPASTDLSTKQFLAVKPDASGKLEVCGLGAKALGILQDKPAAADRAGSVMVHGISKAVGGGTAAYWAPMGPDATGKLIEMDEADEAVLGRSLEAVAANKVFQLLLTHEGSAAAVTDVDAFVAAANYATTGQYLAVKPHSVAGEVIKLAAAADNMIGILQNAPAAGAVALVKTYGVCTAKAGTAGVAAGDRLSVENTGKLITATTGAVVGFALAAISADANGLVFLMPQWLLDMTGQALADAKIYVGNASNLAAAVTMTGDVTNDNAGAQTIANDAVSAAKMGSTVAGSDGCIFKSTSTPNAVAELDVPAGNVVVGTSGDVGLLDMGAAAGNILVDSGTAPASVAVSGDATLAADGTLTIAAAAIEKAMLHPGFTENFAEGLNKGFATLQVDGTAYDATADILNVMHFGTGHKIGMVPIVGQTIAPAMSANGLDIQGDQVANDGMELFSGALGLSGRPFIIGTDAAFFFEATFQIADVAGTDDLHIGFRRLEPVNGTYDNYLDCADLAIITSAAPAAIQISSILNNAATTETDTTDTLANGTSVIFKVLVSAAGVVTYEIDGIAPTVTAAFTFDDGDMVIPFLHYLQAAALTEAFDIEKWDVGYQ